jgi:hypothetical protein
MNDLIMIWIDGSTLIEFDPINMELTFSDEMIKEVVDANNLPKVARGIAEWKLSGQTAEELMRSIYVLLHVIERVKIL